MQIESEIATLLAQRRALGLPSVRQQSVAEARAAYDVDAAVLDPDPPAVDSTDVVVPGAAGDLAGRLYDPGPARTGDGVLVWFHGGGWVLGGLTSHDPALRRLSAAAGRRILAVDYRLAPEHVFPAALDDAEAVLRWAIDHQGDLEATEVAVGGDSAGATLALVAALGCARDLHAPALQVLCYPSLGPELMTESHHEFDRDYGLTADDMAYFYERYLPAGQDHADPRVSPLLTADFHQAPPAVFTVAGFDPLRDEGLACVGLLEGSGVDVTLLDETTLIHGFLRLGALRSARRAIERLGHEIGARLR